jgi:hypothetical protein
MYCSFPFFRLPGNGRAFFIHASKNFIFYGFVFFHGCYSSNQSRFADVGGVIACKQQDKSFNDIAVPMSGCFLHGP